MADEHGPSDLNQEDPLESLLDDETDEEFGLPRFQEHFADSLTPAVLKDWSAKDFASIYVRFRPHLERHAKRFLVNPSQVEEVVQDAFLYLMTTLPELDSELGVLKFLKWKTRLLALDVIRANTRVSIAPLHEQREFEADIPEMGQELERADDAAIVSLALAKLQPRHREALIATLYEEKSAEVVSAQMGLGENAFRQLLFRSRAAFKKALIGEAEISGLSMSEVLSVAARKAAAESGKLISAAGAFLFVLALSLGVIPNFLSSVSSQTVSKSQASYSEFQVSDLPRESEPSPTSEIKAVLPTDANLSDAAAIKTEGELEDLVSGSDVSNSTQSLDRASPNETVKNEEEAENLAERPGDNLALAEIRTALGASAVAALSRASSTTTVLDGFDSVGTVKIDSGSGLIGFVSVDLDSEPGIQGAWFAININGGEFISAPLAWFAKKTINSDGGYLLDYAATDLLIGDTSGAYDFIALQDSILGRTAIQVAFEFSADGTLMDAQLTLKSRI
jgi:RNA polymerase sigma factor (sigma-70 family)